MTYGFTEEVRTHRTHGMRLTDRLYVSAAVKKKDVAAKRLLSHAIHVFSPVADGASRCVKTGPHWFDIRRLSQGEWSPTVTFCCYNICCRTASYSQTFLRGIRVPLPFPSPFPPSPSPPLSPLPHPLSSPFPSLPPFPSPPLHMPFPSLPHNG